ncbi:uncharacterized protein LOC121739708 [Aricia agestis]|uniref:uncharacterized protein LOC121739708 n=1 Tax=Aricia agestis TaxID=91739 RepID=UPI001C203D98|nr:uncharacterized protein LOC121739708 [Aricia agestis]
MKLLLLFNLLQIQKILAEPIEKGDVSTCVTKIVKKFYPYSALVTFVDVKFGKGDNILKELSLLYHINILTRNTDNLENSASDVLIVAAGGLSEFIYKFPNLEREPDWSPKRRHLIIIDNLEERDLIPIFYTLLKLCTYNAIIIDNALDPIIYTYNPFENYACGKRFDRIIQLGNCSGALNDIYFYKYITGLRNCTFRATSAHWPPYSIDPKLRRGPSGVEEYIIDIFSEREQFHIIHNNYSNDAENFSTISKNLSAVGPLTVIQKKKEDMMYGGMLLTNSRASAFDFIWVHLPYVDDVRILVKAATEVAAWRNCYLEFSLAVWLLFVTVFLVYYAVMLLLMKSGDRGILFLKMFDYFFQHGSRLPNDFNFKFFVIFWIWFASLMSSIYQSSLVGLITNPSKNYQIATVEDITKFNLKLCICPMMSKYFVSVDEDLYAEEHGTFDKCDNLLKSIKTVSKSENLYTYTLYAVYSYYKYLFYDEYGKSEIYAFKNPTNKVVYAIYLYKGFPMLGRLQNLSLRLRESGLTTYYFTRLLDDQRKEFVFEEPVRSSMVVVPWYILIIGTTISSVAFIIELNRKPNHVTRHDSRRS